MAVKMQKTSISLPEGMIREIEKKRGYMSRSAWILEVLRRELEISSDRRELAEGDGENG